MGRVDGQMTGQVGKALMQCFVKRLRAPVLEIRTAGTANEERITGEEYASQEETDGIVRMSGARDDFDHLVPESHALAVP